MKIEFMMDSPQDEVHTQQSLHEVQMESITMKTQWGGNFGLEEDCLIVSAWLNTSLDAVQGKEQKHKTYWNRVGSTSIQRRHLHLLVIQTLQ